MCHWGQEIGITASQSMKLNLRSPGLCLLRAPTLPMCCGWRITEGREMRWRQARHGAFPPQNCTGRPYPHDPTLAAQAATVSRAAEASPVNSAATLPTPARDRWHRPRRARSGPRPHRSAAPQRVCSTTGNRCAVRHHAATGLFCNPRTYTLVHRDGECARRRSNLGQAGVGSRRGFQAAAMHPSTKTGSDRYPCLWARR